MIPIHYKMLVKSTASLGHYPTFYSTEHLSSKSKRTRLSTVVEETEKLKIKSTSGKSEPVGRRKSLRISQKPYSREIPSSSSDEEVRNGLGVFYVEKDLKYFKYFWNWLSVNSLSVNRTLWWSIWPSEAHTNYFEIR